MELVCRTDCDNYEYGPNGDNPEIIIYKKR